ncbi:hypothetical protein K0651_13130 [Ornithinimicrobium sp. Arc0846-15]|nr:hypothetical protein [Ornithinimicrobium laminariae]
MKAGLKPLEVALLEVLSRWTDLVEESSADAERTLRRLLSEGILDAERLAAASVTEPEEVKARLNELLVAAGRRDLIPHVTRSQELVAS